MVSSGIEQLDQLLKFGYPDKSAILVVGLPGIGKEALGYWFTQRGLKEGDFCLYVTRLSVPEVQWLCDTWKFECASVVGRLFMKASIIV